MSEVSEQSGIGDPEWCQALVKASSSLSAIFYCHVQRAGILQPRKAESTVSSCKISNPLCLLSICRRIWTCACLLCTDSLQIPDPFSFSAVTVIKKASFSGGKRWTTVVCRKWERLYLCNWNKEGKSTSKVVTHLYRQTKDVTNRNNYIFCYLYTVYPVSLNASTGPK